MIYAFIGGAVCCFIALIIFILAVWHIQEKKDEEYWKKFQDRK